MNSIIVGLKSGNTIKIDNVNYQNLVIEMDKPKNQRPMFMFFNEITFVIENIEYIKKVD